MGQMVERVYDRCTAAVLTVRRFYVKTPAVILCCLCEENCSLHGGAAWMSTRESDKVKPANADAS